MFVKRLFSFFLFAYSLTLMAAGILPKPGVWRFELEQKWTKIPFIVEVQSNKRSWSLVLINGKERIALDEIRVEKNKWIVPLQTYQNYLELNWISKTQVKGYFVNPTKTPELRVSLHGNFGGFRRFDRSKEKPEVNLTGSWAIEMTEEDGTKSNGIALFEQMGQTINASILTSTGDYRYIDGLVSANSFIAAAFDGSLNFVFKGEIIDGVLKAEVLGKSKTLVTGKRDDNAKLPDAYAQTQVETIQFSLPDVTGKVFSLNDLHFKDKPVIIQIFGSWCPNCIDETLFLSPWYEQNKGRGIEIVALSFERASNSQEANKHLKKVVTRRHIPYPVLLAASTSEKKPSDIFTGIKNFISFPTTIFLDRTHKVYRVHAGFTGPGTGLHYEEFKKTFEKTVEELLKN